MNIRKNALRLASLFLAFFVALSAGLVYWQVVVAQQVLSNPRNNRPCLPDNAPQRGRIFDRNGVLLAETKPSKKGCGGLRVYYEPSLAGLIGYYVSPLFSVTGIENQYNKYLTGQVGMTTLDNTVNKLLHRPPVGSDIYLTIDVRIQRLVNKLFDQPVSIDNKNTFKTDRGAVVVMNPQTGEVLAMVSRPSYDPNRLVDTLASGDFSYYEELTQRKDHPLSWRPTQFLYSPGSTYKTMTLLAGLDSGKVTLHDQFDEKHAIGPVVIDGVRFGPSGNNIEDYTEQFPVNTEYGYAHSDNIIFAQLGVKTGLDTWLEYNKRFYVGDTIPFDLPVASSSVMKQDQKTLKLSELAANAFGQGYDQMSPLQIALIQNAVANNGTLMRPYVISKIVDPSGAAVTSNSPTSLGQKVSEQTATLVRQAQVGVIQCGSGLLIPPMHSSKWGIIGKTGTAQVSDDGSVPAHSWMMTSAPYSLKRPSQLPALTIVAMKENGGEGGSTVGPMIASMYDQIFSQKLMQAQEPEPVDANYCTRTGLLQG
ncbi:peptidoglycan glycosyltransferase [Thermosporothrix hazakensis]|jgi:cell division protein FtsI/penicillin-binding protein 2|uniref:Peptidoglycan glycosyltransferase n=1 Tax=Thermosporothrix hazakensis TaxID=644383 RepID=A0A326TQI9_THEHA|nr:penicillin-binding protein 2 [Thermosporothrix hazakensis]PZW18165.1 peptidoglycan glycosyltransferase [Thermosporothrix hazakensis]GCE47518.1 cell division protein FtsI [Thermosporothrix hazakensis]